MRLACGTPAKLAVAAFYLLLFTTIPLVVVDFVNHGAEKQVIAWFIAGMFVVMTVPISVYEVYQHLTHFSQPRLQTYVVRILWMVPIYAVESWFSLRFKHASIYIQAARECYEAYVIYNFLYFLIAYLGDEDELARKLMAKPESKARHLWPMNYILSRWELGSEFVTYCKLGTLQYVVLRCLTALVTFVLQSVGKFGDGEFDFARGYLYVTVINNISQTWALYCLVMFYKATVDDLAPIHPLGKFTVVKAVVFFSFWQALFIAVLVQAGVIRGSVSYSADEVAKGIQDFTICIQMFFAAIAHKFAFPYQDFQVGDEQTRFVRSFIDSAVPFDVIKDVQGTMLPGRFSANDSGQDSERGEEARVVRDRAALSAAFEKAADDADERDPSR